MTWGELKNVIANLTPEQLALPVKWLGDDRGGAIRSLWIAAEDYINPSGDGMEPLSAAIAEEEESLARSLRREPADSPEAVAETRLWVEKNIEYLKKKQPRVAVAGQPFLDELGEGSRPGES